MFSFTQDSDVLVVALQYLASALFVISVLGTVICWVSAIVILMMTAAVGPEGTIGISVIGWAFKFMTAAVVLYMLMKLALGM